DGRRHAARAEPEHARALEIADSVELDLEWPDPDRRHGRGELERFRLEHAEKRDRKMQIPLRRRTAARAAHRVAARALDRTARRVVRPEREEDAAAGRRLVRARLVVPGAAAALRRVDPRLPLRLVAISGLGRRSALRVRTRFAALR